MARASHNTQSANTSRRQKHERDLDERRPQPRPSHLFEMLGQMEHSAITPPSNAAPSRWRGSLSPQFCKAPPDAAAWPRATKARNTAASPRTGAADHLETTSRPAGRSHPLFRQGISGKWATTAVGVAPEPKSTSTATPEKNRGVPKKTRQRPAEPRVRRSGSGSSIQYNR